MNFHLGPVLQIATKDPGKHHRIEQGQSNRRRSHVSWNQLPNSQWQKMHPEKPPFYKNHEIVYFVQLKWHHWTTLKRQTDTAYHSWIEKLTKLSYLVNEY